MSRKLLLLSSAASIFCVAAQADTPNVAVDIAPVHSLVARVMDGVGEPSLIIPAGASPHEYNLRPSEARALQDADLVFLMGEDLTPWLADAVKTLSDDANVTALLDADGIELLDFRENALFESHSHDDAHASDKHDDHDHEHADDKHDDHDDHEHADDKQDDHDHDHGSDKHDDHDHDHEHDNDEHAHGDHDPHAWLSPENAVLWLNVIAAQLSAADPENASAYFGNAAAAKEELAAVSMEIEGVLSPIRGGKFIVFHDAYQYFEVAFDFPASGAISLSDATDPSPARVAEIQGRIKDENISCVLSEPQFNEGLVATVMDGTEAKTAVMDPLGSNFDPGRDLYPQVLRSLAASLASCLS